MIGHIREFFRTFLLFELVKGWVTGEMPNVGEIHHVEK